MLDRLVQRAAGEAQRRGADRRAEDVERRHRHLEALARLAQPVGRPARGTPSNARRASGCGAITSMRSAIVEPRRVGVDHEGRKPAGARRLAGAREHHVMVGDAAVRDPGLFAVEPEMRAVGCRGRRHRRDVGAGLRLGQREGRDRLAVAHRRQIAALQLRRSRRARSSRCRAPAWRRRNRRGRRGTPGFRGRGRACARRAPCAGRRARPAPRP